MRSPLPVLSVRIISAVSSRGRDLTDPGPIKLHEFQESVSFVRDVGIVSHTEKCCFSLYETSPELLPSNREGR